MVAFTFDNLTPWFCLRTRYKHEQVAAGFLRAMPGVTVFSPRIRFRRKTRSGTQWATEALFPGYLFAQFPPAELMPMVRSAHGVTGVVSFGDRYAQVPALALQDLRERFDDDEVRVIEPRLQAGDPVIVASGPFRNLQAVVQTVMDSKERVRILLDFLGRPMTIEVPRNGLVMASRHPLQIPAAGS